MSEIVWNAAPMLCELCFSPISSNGYMAGRHARTLGERLRTTSTAVRVTDWPGTQGLPVWFHSPCYGEALS